MKKNSKSEMNNAVKELFDEVGKYRNTDDFYDLLEFIKRFHNYSPFNCMLLHIQKPGSQYVATPTYWRKEFNRSIKPGSNPLLILKPFGPVQFVYELNDTEGSEPLPEEITNPFRTEGKIKRPKVEVLHENLKRQGIRYEEADHGTCSAGYIQINENQVSSQMVEFKKEYIPVKVIHNIVVNRYLSEESKFTTILHEFAHFLCGHLGTYNSEEIPDRKTVSKNIAEFEAETVAWIVSERLGLHTDSIRYLADYIEEPGTVPNIDLDCILKVAGKIEQMLQKRLPIPEELKIKDGRKE